VQWERDLEFVGGEFADWKRGGKLTVGEKEHSNIFPLAGEVFLSRKHELQHCITSRDNIATALEVLASVGEENSSGINHGNL
jgi:hypothetical protein